MPLKQNHDVKDVNDFVTDQKRLFSFVCLPEGWVVSSVLIHCTTNQSDYVEMDVIRVRGARMWATKPDVVVQVSKHEP